MSRRAGRRVGESASRRVGESASRLELGGQVRSTGGPGRAIWRPIGARATSSSGDRADSWATVEWDSSRRSGWSRPGAGSAGGGGERALAGPAHPAGGVLRATSCCGAAGTNSTPRCAREFNCCAGEPAGRWLLLLLLLLPLPPPPLLWLASASASLWWPRETRRRRRAFRAPNARRRRRRAAIESPLSVDSLEGKDEDDEDDNKITSQRSQPARVLRKSVGDESSVSPSPSSSSSSSPPSAGAKLRRYHNFAPSLAAGPQTLVQRLHSLKPPLLPPPAGHTFHLIPVYRAYICTSQPEQPHNDNHKQ